MKPRVLVLDDWEGLIEAASCWSRVDHRVELRFLKEPIASVSDSELADVHFLLAVRERTAIDQALLQRLPRLELILQTGGHAYHIDSAAAQARGIAIALGRRVQAPLRSVPELTFAFALNLLHRVHEGDRLLRAGQWPLLTGKTLAGRRLGILGLGRHGTRVAEIARTAFAMNVVAWDRGVHAHDAQAAIPRLPLPELLATSDVVSIHLRLSPESTGLLSRERLQQMKPGALLLNTSRGAIVDEAALVEALQQGPLAGAGLDVFTEEPLPVDSPLRRLHNVLLTPHVGWTVEEVFEEFARIACAQLSDYLDGVLAPSELLVVPAR